MPIAQAACRSGPVGVAVVAAVRVSFWPGAFKPPIASVDQGKGTVAPRPAPCSESRPMPRRLATPLLTLSLLLTGCASGSNQQNAPVQVDELVSWIERVHVEAERSRQAIGDSFDRLNTLASGNFAKEAATVSYARFVQSIDAAEEQAHRFRETVGPMVAAGEPVFREWQKSTAAITSERLRQRSELRFAVTKERYDAITKAVVPAQDQFDAYVKALRDHATFLAHDLNASALDEIQEEVKVVANNARDLDRLMESSLAASRAYVENAALPAAPSGLGR